MPFASEKQRRFMYARHPEIAERWAAEEKKGNPVPEKKKRLSTILGRRLGRAVGGAVKAPPLTAAQKYEKAVAEMEAKLGGRRKKPKPGKPMTPGQVRSQGAADLREGIMEGTALGRLADVLKLKPKKKRKR